MPFYPSSPLPCRAYHLSRTGFFVVQGLAGLLASRATNGTDGPSPLLRSR